MRIAMVTPSYLPRIGGLETHVRALTDALRKVGIEVEVLTNTAGPDTDGVRRFPAGSGSVSAFLTREKSRYDIVHVHSYHALLALPTTFAARAPVVLTPHYHGTGHTPLRAALHRVYRPAGRRMLERSAAIICVSHAEARLVDRHFPSAAPRVHVIPNAVDRDRFATATPTHRAAPYVLSYGRLAPYKRLDRVIAAWPHVARPVQLVVVGTGPARAALAAQAAQNGVQDRVAFVDCVGDDDLPALVAGAEAVVTLSEHEAFGLTVLETIAAGRPVVVSDIPAHREAAAAAGGKGVEFLAPDDDAQSVAAAVTRTIGTPRAVAGSVRIPDWTDAARATAGLYDTVARTNRVPA